MQVVIYKNRGAIVPRPEAFVKDHPECGMLSLGDVRSMEVYRFDCTFQGLPAAQWAWFWLKKHDNRARKFGTYVPVPYLVKESAITPRACFKAFKKSKKRSKPTRVKMVSSLYNSSLF